MFGGGVPGASIFRVARVVFARRGISLILQFWKLVVLGGIEGSLANIVSCFPLSIEAVLY